MSAIRVLERLAPDGKFLFSHAVHNGTSRIDHGVLRPSAPAVRIEDFVAWVNREATALGLPEQAIEADPMGRIGTQRFRRTLACARSVSDQVAVRSAGVETRNLVSPLQLAGLAAA
ncbi:hypothetical protein AB0N81_22710 [Streptomyces sp. NPDC093510]|uniref:hypothetical protein n=1 Tax=Streptomyces sp. NPDC093510 TaxID=3155199 RepID=UPI0034207CFD